MSVDTLNAQINNIRDAADHAKATYRDSSAALQANTTLDAEYRSSMIADLGEQTKSTLSALLAQEEQAIQTEVDALNRTIDAKTGDSSGDVISFRDALDRADAIPYDQEQEAFRLLNRSLVNDDPSLAAAIFRRGMQAGWTTVVNAYRDANPEAGHAIDALANITAFRDDVWRPAAYVLIGA